MSSAPDETAQTLLKWAEGQLAACDDIPNPRWEARHLLQDLTGLSTSVIVTEPTRRISSADTYRSWVTQRASGVPASRITGMRAFMGYDFLVSEATLDPRSDSEVLVEQVLRTIPRDWRGTIADLGTGTGCLLLSVLAERPNATGIGIDLSFEAVQTASENARRLSLESRSHFLNGSWSNALAGNSIDLLISNPPYISQSELGSLDAAVRCYDPVQALDGGVDGLQAYRSLLKDARRILKANSCVFLEIGWQQRSDVFSLLTIQGFKKGTCISDLGGRDRVISAVNP